MQAALVNILSDIYVERLLDGYRSNRNKHDMVKVLRDIIKCGKIVYMLEGTSKSF